MAIYAAGLSGNVYFGASSSNIYQFGTGDFSIESWVQAAVAGASGTVVSRKGTGGDAGNGGFLLVIRADGSLKFATDNGFGFFEIDTVTTRVNDGSWHHVAAVRQGPSLVIYLDGLPVSATPRGSASPPLNVNNSLSLIIGTTQQQEEPYKYFSGALDAVTVWNVVRSATQVVSDMRTVLSGTEPGLVGYWTFDSQNGNDSSPYHNNATAYGTITYTSPGAPITGGDVALRLANGGYLTAASTNAYQFGVGDFSVEAWLRTAAPGGNGTIVARKDSAGGVGDGGFLVVLRADSTLKFATDSGTGFFEIDTGATLANDGLWHYVAAVRQGASLRLYLDGLELPATTRGNANPPLNVNSNLPLTIGITQQQQEPYKQFIGDLGAVTLWNVARSAAQVASDMRTQLAGTEAGLVGYWTFGYYNGLDLSPTCNNALPNGAVSYITPGAPWQYYAAVLANQGFLQTAANAAYRLGVQDFTLEAWVQCAAGQHGTVIARKGVPGGQAEDGGFLLVINPDGNVKFATDNGFAFFQVITTQPTNVNNGQWHFLAAVRRGAALEIYLDGGTHAVQTSGTGTPPLNVNNNLSLTIGTTQQTQEPQRFFTGQIDAASIWNTARTPAAIAADMSTRLQGNESGLIGYWSFDFRDGRDTSPIRNTAASVGSVSFLPPGAPIGALGTPIISAVDYEGTVLSCTWTAVGQPGVTQYLLALFNSQGNQIASNTTTDTHTTLSSALTAGTSYTVRVQASLGGNTGGWSAPEPVVVSAPTNLNVMVTTSAILGQWDVLNGAANYRMALYEAGQVISSQDGAATTGSLPLPGNRSGSYTIQVRGLAGSGSLSTGPWSSVIPILEAPALTQVQYDGTQVSAQWSALLVPGVTGYVLAVFQGATEIAHVATAGLQTSIPISPNPAYVVQVQATGVQTIGPWSTALPIIVTVPANLLAGADATGTQVVAIWQAVSGVDGYRAELSTNGTWGVPQVVAVPSVSFAGQIAAGAVYQVRVNAYKGSSSGPWSPAIPGPFLRNATATYDGFGRLTYIDFVTSNITYTYDALGNISSEAVIVV